MFFALERDMAHQTQSCEVLVSLVPVVTEGLVVGYFHKYKHYFLVVICLKTPPCIHMQVKPKPSLYTYASET